MRKLEGSVLCLALAAVVAVACGSSAERGFADDPDGGTSGGVGPSITPVQACVNGRICVGQDIYTCGADGLPTKDKLGDCYGADQACVGGACKSGCEAVSAQGSNVGCE